MTYAEMTQIFSFTVSGHQLVEWHLGVLCTRSETAEFSAYSVSQKKSP